MYDIDVTLPVLWADGLTVALWIWGLYAAYKLLRFLYGLIPTS